MAPQQLAPDGSFAQAGHVSSIQRHRSRYFAAKADLGPVTPSRGASDGLDAVSDLISTRLRSSWRRSFFGRPRLDTEPCRRGGRHGSPITAQARPSAAAHACADGRSP